MQRIKQGLRVQHTLLRLFLVDQFAQCTPKFTFIPSLTVAAGKYANFAFFQ